MDRMDSVEKKIDDVQNPGRLFQTIENLWQNSEEIKLNSSELLSHLLHTTTELISCNSMPLGTRRAYNGKVRISFSAA